ncbi:alpha/beta fold hydrolase [Pseudodesulfovibrio sp.]|uniref:YheT family hydrolase n=1 Tax=Pseudodesulfovibrio sp. TaxID=2035812 RepID=UPI002617E389|nr:alpha/beta fold hydrolase [Pseudodesulfovibrio sp.]MDD3312834.1 alpha/beta fold hydrolase [Pseudodesulfovibrio sp.]
MPVLPVPDYRPAPPFRRAHLSTLYPTLLRPSPLFGPIRKERVTTPDNDFLTMDVHPSRVGKSRKVAIISHGLEGDARRKYVVGMARAATGLGFDAACWNQRGCGGEPNLLPRSYHSGETGDLHTVVTHCLASGRYDQVVLIGFSMGGNQILKYLGEDPDRVPAGVAAAAVFSVPCDLGGSERMLARPSRRIYVEYFMLGLRAKVREKEARFPDQVPPHLLRGVYTLREFDNRYTAPYHGFADAADYYARASSLPVLGAVRVPTLLVNARNDPFLTPACFPEEAARNNPNLFLETPRYGGHVGFVASGLDNVYWSERRAAAFLSELPG